jgi:hypothetical protein
MSTQDLSGAFISFISKEATPATNLFVFDDVVCLRLFDHAVMHIRLVW